MAFHVNPESGLASECRAEIRCPFGGPSKHHETPEAARKAFEDLMGDETVPSSLSAASAEGARRGSVLLSKLDQAYNAQSNLGPELSPHSLVRVPDPEAPGEYLMLEARDFHKVMEPGTYEGEDPETGEAVRLVVGRDARSTAHGSGA